LLVTLGLVKYFHAIIVSCEVAHPKPDRQIFLRAAAELGCEPVALVHVGDSVEEDLDGARAARLQAVLIDRSGPHARHGEAESAGSAEVPPPYVGGYEVISSLMDLQASLESAGASGHLN
jgi:FMN phosphatase YigB (HAD superfamily)